MNNSNKIEIDGRAIGAGEPTFIVAEVGINHNGDMDLAHKMIDSAAEVGADAVKFQTTDADASYVPGTPSYQAFAGISLSYDNYQELIDHSRNKGIIFFTTPGDWPSLELCKQLSLPAIKISSGLMTNLPVVLEAATLGVPIIMSTGGAYLWEVGEVVQNLEKIGKKDIALLHCVSIYPAADEMLNLSAIPVMQTAFPYPIGYSDHSMGRVASISAVTHGACIIEKHFTINRELPGGDNQISTEPQEFETLVSEIRACESMWGINLKSPHLEEMEFRSKFRRRLVANCDIGVGQELSMGLIGLKRPLEPRGLPPEYLEKVIGKRTRRSIQKHEPITWDSITEN